MLRTLHAAVLGLLACPLLPDLHAQQLLEHDALARRKAAILAIHAITGETFGLHPYRTAEQNASALAAAARWLDERKTAQR